MEAITDYFENHANSISTFFEGKCSFLTVKAGGAYRLVTIFISKVNI
jgi:hypothetical protein